MADKTITVTLKRSKIGAKPKAQGTLRALGLSKIGDTNTLPLHAEILYNEYQFTASFAVASLLALLALL